LQKLVIHLESKIDALPIRMYLVQCPKCGFYVCIEEWIRAEKTKCPNCEHPGLVTVDMTPDTDHKFVGWGWQRVEG